MGPKRNLIFLINIKKILTIKGYINSAHHSFDEEEVKLKANLCMINSKEQLDLNMLLFAKKILKDTT